MTDLVNRLHERSESYRQGGPSSEHTAVMLEEASSRISQQDAELERVRRELEEAKADKARLDFLDECNKRLNTHHGNTYGWEMVMNHNVNRLMTGHLAVDLNDAKAHGFKSCRGAIDDEMKRVEAARALRAKAEETGQ